MANTQTISQVQGHEEYELQSLSSVRHVPPIQNGHDAGAIRQFWRRQVAFPIPQKAMRDHLGR